MKTTMERLSEPELRRQVGAAVREVLAAVMTTPTPEAVREGAGRLARLRPYVAEHIQSVPAMKLAFHLRKATADLNEAWGYLALPEMIKGGREVLDERAAERLRTARRWLGLALSAVEEWEGGRR